MSTRLPQSFSIADGPAGHQQSHYYPSGLSYNPDITAEGFNGAGLCMGHNEPDGFETEQYLDLPAEFHVPSQAPSLSQAGFPRMTSQASLAPYTRSPMQPVYTSTQPGYVREPIAAAGARGERQIEMNDNTGQATWRAEGYTFATYIPHNPDAGNQGSLNQGEGYYLAPPATHWFSEPPVPSFVGPSGRVAYDYRTDRNSISTTHDSLQPRSQQASSLPSSTAYSDLRQYFPLSNDEHRKKRDALKAVMQSPWKQNNEFEPEASLLLQFMSLDPTEGRWYCTFWKDGKPCDCSCKKRDHAKGHIRSHIDLLPFVCNSRCPNSATGCGKRYPAVEPLQKHRKGKTMCDHCGHPFLPGNMKRHVQICHPEV